MKWHSQISQQICEWRSVKVRGPAAAAAEGRAVADKPAGATPLRRGGQLQAQEAHAAAADAPPSGRSPPLTSRLLPPHSRRCLPCRWPRPPPCRRRPAQGLLPRPRGPSRPPTCLPPRGVGGRTLRPRHAWVSERPWRGPPSRFVLPYVTGEQKTAAAAQLLPGAKRAAAWRRVVAPTARQSFSKHCLCRC